jgi:hypothetical protein
MKTRSKTVQQDLYIPFLPDENEETIVISNEMPNLKRFVKKFNYSLLRVLKPSFQKSGPMRAGEFVISKQQYQVLSDMGLTHRFKQQASLLSEFNIKTYRFFTLDNRVVVQNQSFQARLKKPVTLKYHDQDMVSKFIDGADYYLKFKFKKREEVIRV